MGLFGNSGYDPRGKPRDDFNGGAVPAGKYLLEVTKAEERQNKPNREGRVTGEHLFIELTIRSKAYAGRKVFHRFNLKNDSAKAEEIGQRQFASFLDAIGMGDVIIKSPPQLLGKIFCGRLKVDGDQNEVAGYEPKGEFTESAASPTPAGQPQAPAWQRRPAHEQPAPATAQPADQQGQQQPAQADPAGQAEPQQPAAAPAPAPAPAQQPAPARPLKPWEIKR